MIDKSSRQHFTDVHARLHFHRDGGGNGDLVAHGLETNEGGQDRNHLVLFGGL